MLCSYECVGRERESSLHLVKGFDKQEWGNVGKKCKEAAQKEENEFCLPEYVSLITASVALQPKVARQSETTQSQPGTGCPVVRRGLRAE